MTVPQRNERRLTALAVVCTIWAPLALAACTVSSRDARHDSAASQSGPQDSAARDTVNFSPAVTPAILQFVPLTAGTVEVRGSGYSLQVPAGTVATRDSLGSAGFQATMLSGPLRSTPERTPDQGPSRPQPTFQLRLSETPLPAGVTPVEWVKRLCAQRNRTLASEAKLDEVTTDSVIAGALRLLPYCGDCEAVELYMPVQTRLVAMATSSASTSPAPRSSRIERSNECSGPSGDGSGAGVRRPR